MRPRYLLSIAHGGAHTPSADRLAELTGLDVIHREHPLVALANPAALTPFPTKGGVVLGTLFRRNDREKRDDCSQPCDAMPPISTESDLLTRFWGGYVSAKTDGTCSSVMRDPSGALPCYFTRTASTTFMASDIDLLLASDIVRPAIDWPALARFLYWDGLPTAETVLDGISELLPGFALRLEGDSAALTAKWSPWAFTTPVAGRHIAIAADRLRQTVQDCVAAWASLYPRALVSISGGLDSSIVAACLATPGVSATCVTMFTDDPMGDERAYARSLCSHLGLGLTEQRFEMAGIDPARALGDHLPRPIGRAQEQAYEVAHVAAATQAGAAAFFTGNGGDNVFAYSQSAAAIADRALDEGLSPGLFSTIRDVCKQTQSGVFPALRAALRLTLRSPSYRWRPTPALLEPSLCAALAVQPAAHPWLVAPSGALPGKAAQIAALLRPQLSLEPDRSRHLPVITPLLSQPIVEESLAIPSWQWRHGGRDRAVAREAFATALPAQIIARRSKGSPDPFCNAIIREHHSLIERRLLDGHLAQQGLIDRLAIEKCLRRECMMDAERNVRLLQLLNVEAWVTAKLGEGS